MAAAFLKARVKERTTSVDQTRDGKVSLGIRFCSNFTKGASKQLGWNFSRKYILTRR